MQRALYRDYDALAYNPKHVGDERGAINHIKKTKQRKKGVEIVFDPKAHKDFVTGFRKRKQQRRKEAEKQLLKKSKEQRLQDRAERRRELKHQLGLPDDYGVQDSDSEQGVVDPSSVKSDVKQYQQGEYMTTVAVTALNMGDSDVEDEQQQQSSEQGSDDLDDPQQQHQQQQKGKQHSRNTKTSGSLKASSGKVKKGSKSNKTHQKKKKKHKKK